MKKNKKGFTLVELIASIALLSMLLLLAVPNIVKILSQSKEDLYNKQILTLQKAAKEYMVQNTYEVIWQGNQAEVTLRQLSNEGFIGEKVINPITGLEYDLDASKVVIVKNDQQYIYEPLLFETSNIHFTANGNNPDIVNCSIGGTYGDPGVIFNATNETVYANEDDLRNLNNHFHIAGTYTLGYEHLGEKMHRVVIVQNLNKPVIQLSETRIILSSTNATFDPMDYVEKVTDECEGDITGNLTDGNLSTGRIVSNVILKTPGVYTVTYIVQNSGGTETQAKLYVEITSEELVVNGNNPDTVSCSASGNYADLGATLSSDSSITVFSETTLPLAYAGQHTLLYKYTLSEAPIVTRRVVNITNNNTPTIALKMDKVTIPVTQTSINPMDYVEAITDPCEGDLRNNLIDGDVATGYTSTNVILGASGTYLMTYRVTNKGGKTATATLEIEINVPELTLNGSNPDNVSCHPTNTYKDPGAYVNVTGETIFSDTTLSLKYIGSYSLRYNYTGLGQTFNKTRTVNITNNNQPTINTTANSISLTIGQTFNPMDYVISVIDLCDGDITGHLTDGSTATGYYVTNVTSSVAGKYYVRFQVTNSGGITVSKEIPVNVGTIETPLLTIPNPNANGWFTTKPQIYVNYDKSVADGFQYAISTNGGVSYGTWKYSELDYFIVTTQGSNIKIRVRTRKGNSNFSEIVTTNILKIDTTPPENLGISIGNYTDNSLQAIALASEPHSEIVKYEFSINNGAYVNNSTNSTYQYTGLTSKTNTIKIRVTNSAGLSKVYSNSITIPPTGAILVYDATDFQNIKNNVSGYYFLMNDIDMSGISWASIANFTGTIDGNGRTISNLTSNTGGIIDTAGAGAVIRNLNLKTPSISRTSNNVGGIINTVSGANVTIENVIIDGGTVNGTSRTNVGGLVGIANYNTNIIHSGNRATVSGSTYVGGLAGSLAANTVINQSFATGEIKSTGNSDGRTGGLIGYIVSGTVSESYATGNIDAYYGRAGGLIGYNGGANISKCYATGNVKAVYTSSNYNYGAYLGGLIGYNQGSITNSYALGSVSGAQNYNGGLVGYNSSGTVNHAYSTGTVAGSGNTDPSIGYSNSNVTDVYYIADTSQRYTSSYATRINTIGADYGSYNGFDFDTVWTMERGITLPYLVNVELSSKNYVEQASYYAREGLGTADSPYLVKTPMDFVQMKSSIYAYFRISNNIDMTGVTYDSISSFYGMIDGNGRTVSNLTSTNGGMIDNAYAGSVIKNLNLLNPSISRTANYVGSIVNRVAEATVTLENIKVSGGTVSGSGSVNYVGGLVGYAQFTTVIRDSVSNATISGSTYVGGVAGYVTGSSNISKTGSTGNVTSSGNTTGKTGGLIGYIDNGSVSESYATGNVSAQYRYIGGLIGYNNSANISKSYATGNVKVTDTSSGEYAGGLIGYNTTGIISDSYALGNVSSAETYVGGLVGYHGGGSINRSYSIGTVNGTSNVDVSVGYSAGSLTNVYYIGDTSQKYASSYSKMVPTISSPSTVYVGFNFDTVWAMEQGVTIPYIKSIGQAPKNKVSLSSYYLREGFGTEDNPYLVKTTTDFVKMATSSYGHFSITNDIDMTGISYTSINNFGGVINGNNYKISNLTTTTGGIIDTAESGAVVKNIVLENPAISRSANYIGGIINRVTSGTVTLDNIKINNGTISATGSINYVGGLVGYAQYTTVIKNSMNHATVSGSAYVGGIAGYVMNNSNISQTKATGNVTSNGNTTGKTGGLVGYMDNGSISESYATGNINAQYRYTGGLIGHNNAANISKCYATGNVKVTDGSSGEYVGGLIGYNTTGTISDSYALGNVSSNENYVGGLIGYNTGNISRAYSNGSVTGTSSVGAIFGSSSGVLTNVYWNTQTSGKTSSSYGTAITNGGKNKADYVGFDFTSIWNITENLTYPYLRNMPS